MGTNGLIWNIDGKITCINGHSVFCYQAKKKIVLFPETGRVKSFYKVTRPQTGVIFFLIIQRKARSNKLHRDTYVKSAISKKKQKKNKECLQFVYIHMMYVFTFQIKIYARCSLITNVCVRCLHFAINCISLLCALHRRLQSHVIIF